MKFARPLTAFVLALAVGAVVAPVASAASPGSLSADVAASGPKFVTPDAAPAGGTLPQRTASGDFNGDGKRDAVTVNEGPSTVFGPGIGVSLGDGKGNLGPTVTTEVGGNDGACDLAVADWNGDALDDLVVLGCVTSGPGNLVALISSGDGTFTTSQTWAGTDVQIVAGDFNRDGKADFVTSAKGTARVTTYLGKGNGTFNAPVAVTPSFDSYDLEAGDVNNDGKLDLIGASGGPTWTMLGAGDGSFGAQKFHASNVVTGIELAVADFNNDDKLDVAVVDASGGHVGIGIGVGDGTFADGDQISTQTTQAVWIVAGTFTKDGDVDLVAALAADSNSATLLAGKGNGHFAKGADWVVGSNGLSSADFDQNGRTDLVAVDPVGLTYLSVAQGKGFYAPALSRGPNSHDLVDLDNDGDLDKVSGASGLVHGGFLSEMIVQLGDGHGHFGKAITSHVRGETYGSFIGDIDLADINGDGVLDVVGGFDNFQPSPNNLFWALGKGDGSFGKATLSTVGETNADVDAVAAADVNADGKIDIVANNLSKMVVKLGTGTGSFGAPIASGVGSAANRAVLVADFTGDGVVDVVTTVRTGSEDFGSGEIRLQKGDGKGMFTVVKIQNVDSNLAGGTAADLNADGRPDVVTAGQRGSKGGRNALWVLLTTASGTLGTPTAYGGPFREVDTGDVDLDGDIDIATTAIGGIDLYLNDGSGSFPKSQRIIAAGALGVVGDLDDDGDPDIVSGSSLGEFAVHINAR